MTVILIKPRSKSLKEIKVNTTPETKIRDILEEYAKVNKKNSNRIKLSKIDDTGKSKAKQLQLKYLQTVSQNSLQDQDIIFSKDLGPQISWKLVFLIEYLGPMLINTFFYYFIYDASNVTLTQLASYLMVMLHFFKREYETTFIHTFSLSTMPFFNLFKNCLHYWILSGVFFGITLFHDHQPRGSAITEFVFHVRDCPNDQLILYGLIWAIAELSNFYCHIILRNLRNDGSKAHKIPYGFLFNYVTVPNYFCESVGWLMFALLNNNPTSWLFFIVGTAQMYIWGLKKHANLKKEFPNYPKNRKVFIPFVL